MGVFGQSILATPPRIGGVQLRVFSAFHALALLELDSPYVTGEDRDPSYGETVAALMVCASQRADGFRKAASWSRVKWWLYWLTHDHATVANALADHIGASAQCPKVWVESKEVAAKTTGAAWPFYVVSIAAQHLHGIDYGQIWDMPLGELMCHKAIISECNGGPQIAENELANIERRRERQAS